VVKVNDSNAKAPLVSIIIPVYNDERHVAQAIQSALGQTLGEVEVIVVDDGSTDGTSEVLKRYEGRIKIIRQENKGVSAARNAGFNASCGKYVCFLDSDDMILPNMTKVLLALLETHRDAGMAFGAWTVVDEKDGSSTRQCAPMIDDFTEYLLTSCPSPPNATMIRRDWFESVGGFDETLKSCDDWDLWRKLWLAGCGVVRTEETVSVFRRRAGSKSRNPENMRFHLAALDKYVRALGDRASERARREAYSTLWLKDGANWVRANKPSQAAKAWAKALQYDPTIFERGGTWPQVFRRADAAFPHYVEHSSSWFTEMESLLRSVFKESIAQYAKTKLTTPSYRRAVAALRFTLSMRAFKDGLGCLARRWLVRAMLVSPVPPMRCQNWRSILKVVLGPNISSLIGRLLTPSKV